MSVYLFLLLQSTAVPPKLQKYHRCRENKVSVQALPLQLLFHWEKKGGTTHFQIRASVYHIHIWSGMIWRGPSNKQFRDGDKYLVLNSMFFPLWASLGSSVKSYWNPFTSRVPSLARKAQMDHTDLINSVIKGVTASRDIAPSPVLKELIAKTALRDTSIKLPLIFLRSHELQVLTAALTPSFLRVSPLSGF